MSAVTVLNAEQGNARTDKAGAAIMGSNDLKNGRAFYCLDNIEIKCARIRYNARRNLIEREPTSSS